MHSGIRFRSDNTTSSSRNIVSEAVRAVNPMQADAIGHESDWRLNFGNYYLYLVQAGLDSAEVALKIADHGLTAVHDEILYNDIPLSVSHTDPQAKFEFETREVYGEAEPMDGIAVPYRGESLRGNKLLTQLKFWHGRGLITSTFYEAIAEVMDNPDWLRLDGETIVVLGALAETGPLRQLLAWGVDVIAVDLPAPTTTRRLTSLAQSGASRVRIPMRPGTDPNSAIAGADLSREVHELAYWLCGFNERLILGHYYYTDGAPHLLVSAAGDALNHIMFDRRPQTGIAYLFSPTSVYAVGAHEIGFSTRAYEQDKSWWRAPARTVSRGRLLTPNYSPESPFGICDAIIPQQGHYYALAKQIQRWRAALEASRDRTVSGNVAPLTFTQSLLASKSLTAACVGASKFGIEVLEPETAQALMAVMLVHDLKANRQRSIEPWREELHGAAHNGLWTCAYSPRSVLSLAAVAGMGSGPHR